MVAGWGSLFDFKGKGNVYGLQLHFKQSSGGKFISPLWTGEASRLTCRLHMCMWQEVSLRVRGLKRNVKPFFFFSIITDANKFLHNKNQGGGISIQDGEGIFANYCQFLSNTAETVSFHKNNNNNNNNKKKKWFKKTDLNPCVHACRRVEGLPSFVKARWRETRLASFKGRWLRTILQTDSLCWCSMLQGKENFQAGEGCSLLFAHHWTFLSCISETKCSLLKIHALNSW